MDIEHCRNCHRVFISYGNSYCNDCKEFSNLVEEKVEMLLRAINEKED